MFKDQCILQIKSTVYLKQLWSLGQSSVGVFVICLCFCCHKTDEVTFSSSFYLCQKLQQYIYIKNACVLTSVGAEICAVCACRKWTTIISVRVQWLSCIAGWEGLAFCNSQEMGQDLAAVSLLLLFDHWPVVDCQVGSPCSVTLGAFREEKKKGREEKNVGL